MHIYEYTYTCAYFKNAHCLFTSGYMYTNSTHIQMLAFACTTEKIITYTVDTYIHTNIHNALHTHTDRKNTVHTYKK